jgi:hypothetical protein
LAGVILLHLADNDRSLDGHMTLMDSDLAGSDAYTDVEA